MTAAPARPARWFDQGGASYARFRPDYPPTLAAHLASISPCTSLAVDVGCGTGQLTRQLGDHFSSVLGVDPSADQLASATTHERVRYACAPAERLPVEEGSVALITAAQAAHWFDLDLFYAEVIRVARPGAVIALVSYGTLTFSEQQIDRRFRAFNDHEIGRFWPPERRMVDSGYAGIKFPFSEVLLPTMAIQQQWALDAVLGYLGTWSAVRAADRVGQGGLLDRFARDLADLWGAPDALRSISWPISARIGYIHHDR